MNILGINSFFEHPSVALIVDDELVFAIEDERLTRIKHGKRYTPYRTYIPYDSICEALRYANLKANDIDHIGYSYSSTDHLKSLWGCFAGKRISSFREEIAAYGSVRRVRTALLEAHELPYSNRDVWRQGDFKRAKYKEWDHHIAHAASAYYCSGFDECLTVVADGSGENSCTSIYSARDGLLNKVESFNLPDSLGFFYSFVTTYLGFEAFSDEYKVMGMASYGKPTYVNEMRKVLCTRKGGYKLNFEAIRNLETIFGPARSIGEEIEEKHLNIASSAQKVLEETLISMIGHHLGHQKHSNLCLAGGTFLNCVANEKICRHFNQVNVFVQPASHDAGTAIGAAALSKHAATGNGNVTYQNMFLGNVRDDDEIKSAIVRAGLEYSYFPNENDLTSEIAKHLVNEKVLALYRGRSEFGPRALGATSFIASPKSAKTRAKLNEIKSREQFRPLAPLVTVESFDKYFEGTKNKYMMMAVKAKTSALEEAPAIVHVDGTARTQTVAQDDDAFLYTLLKKFEGHTGTPILVNTSLNVRGEPMCESPSDAICAAFTADVDLLCMGPYLIQRFK